MCNNIWELPVHNFSVNLKLFLEKVIKNSNERGFPRRGISLTVQWLRICTSNAGDVGSIPGQRTKIPDAKKKKKKKTSQNPRLSLPIHEHGISFH